MNITLMQDQRIALGGGLALLVATVVLAPMVQLSGSLSNASLSTAPAWKASRPVVVVAKKRPVSRLNNANQLRLKSMFNDYTYTFTGTTICQGEPCSVRMEVLIHPDGSEPVWLSFKSASNGRYWFEVPFLAKPRQPLDWTLTLRDANDQEFQTGGRQILMDEKGQTFAKDFEIR